MWYKPVVIRKCKEDKMLASGSTDAWSLFCSWSAFNDNIHGVIWMKGMTCLFFTISQEIRKLNLPGAVFWPHLPSKPNTLIQRLTFMKYNEVEKELTFWILGTTQRNHLVMCLVRTSLVHCTFGGTSMCVFWCVRFISHGSLVYGWMNTQHFLIGQAHWSCHILSNSLFSPCSSFMSRWLCWLADYPTCLLGKTQQPQANCRGSV